MSDNTNNPLFIKALLFLTKFEDRFLELAALLRKLQEKSPADFKSLISIPQLGKRKAYYLVVIDRAFGGYPQLRERLLKVGWTRLALIAPYVTAGDVDDALQFAEANSAWAIRQALKGKDLPVGARSVLLHFSPEQFAFFATEILKHGAVKNGEGFIDKELAVIAALQKAGQV
jgi:hypothetical protein